MAFNEFILFYEPKRGDAMLGSLSKQSIVNIDGTATTKGKFVGWKNYPGGFTPKLSHIVLTVDPTAAPK